MPRPDRRAFGRAFLASILVAGCGVLLAADPAPFRFRAPIDVREPAPFVELALPPTVYANVEQAGLADLRVVDSRGERVPFALLAARSSQRDRQVGREARLYPLPARPRADGVWPAPVEVVVEGDRIQVRRTGPATAASAAGPAATASLAGGWVIDLGETRPGDAAVRSVRLGWSGPPEFSAGFRLETSDDLRQWRGAGAGQLLSLQSPSGPLTQPVVPLPERPGRFVRLLWDDAATAPALSSAVALTPEPERVAVDAPRELALRRRRSPSDARRPTPPAATPPGGRSTSTWAAPCPSSPSTSVSPPAPRSRRSACRAASASPSPGPTSAAASSTASSAARAWPSRRPCRWPATSDSCA
jgi:hypothetical protein